MVQYCAFLQQNTEVKVNMTQEQAQTVVIAGAGSYGSRALIFAVIMSIASFFCGFWTLAFSITGVFLAIAVSLWVVFSLPHFDKGYYCKINWHA